MGIKNATTEELWDELATVNCEIAENEAVEDDDVWQSNWVSLGFKRRLIARELERRTGEKLLGTNRANYGRP